MTTIRLTNTKTRTKEDFVPIDPTNVRMYVCGPTVYDRAHLGNARPVIVFDVLFRLLRHVYGADHVTYVRNFTDVDDKINAEAQRRKGLGDPRSLEELIRERTEETIRWYHEDMDALGALRPTEEPRATEWIGAMITMTQDLIDKGHAYEKAGHVLFRVRSYTGYGKLSGRSVDDMIAGARVEVAPFKEDPMDFVLWKPSTDDLPGWDSPWGRGRPGWHIECSAMSRELLGESFDIHGGGIDLQFPHHENEIAQSMCAHPEGGFAKVWMHNEMLQVEGKKMSKSLGNFFTVRDLLDKEIPGDVIRFVFLSTHYSKPMDWTEEKAKAARNEIARWVGMLAIRHDLLDKPLEDHGLDNEMLEALSDDLNTSLAISRLMRTARFLDNSPEFMSLDDRAQYREECIFIASARLLGFDLLELAKKERARAPVKDLGYFELRLVQERITARETGDFAVLDALKSALVSAGLEVRMSKDAVELKVTPVFDPAKLEALK
ncbi:cysteine--tRNA ligase [Albidovulum sediminis]|uniref:Cysteine--tRNA ligase n=1 Tax=Albidovulum sediminis TaxID=3066345 RepID=A0ABT2NIG5_9RHOB|nr:cysteine--tRNA ligase [Defluviimonas sediminis]MCT8328701.1 cysteine--tRNA ligase [Defluviimonas sediminis]